LKNIINFFKKSSKTTNFSVNEEKILIFLDIFSRKNAIFPQKIAKNTQNVHENAKYAIIGKNAKIYKMHMQYANAYKSKP
jgi:hypothetical protein